MNTRPLVAILGSTGVGKSKLAVEIALALSRKLAKAAEAWSGAEVINADSMQVYHGLDIITNKISEDETQGVKHHLIGFKDIGEQYVVHEWIQDALPLIDHAHRESRLPLVVGGTAYWIQHLVFPDRLAPTDEGLASEPLSSALQASMATMSSEQLKLFKSLDEVVPESTPPDVAFSLHGLLSQLDPETAGRWHWKDTRKVLRSLNIVRENGYLPSELFATQSQHQVTPRYRTLLFWLNARPDALNHRLDQRIETMVQLGLVNEIRTMRTVANQPNEPVDYTQGIFQAIGYKEFAEYLDDPAHRSDLFEDAMERMRVSTRKYAQRQIKWIKNRLLPAVHSAGPDAASIVVLDASSLDVWSQEVKDRALACLEKFLKGDAVGPDDSSPSMAHLVAGTTHLRSPLDTLAAMRKTVCQTCTSDPTQPFMIDEAQWKAHTSSRQHKRAARRALNQERLKLYRASKLACAPNLSGSDTELHAEQTALESEPRVAD